MLKFLSILGFAAFILSGMPFASDSAALRCHGLVPDMPFQSAPYPPGLALVMDKSNSVREEPFSDRKAKNSEGETVVVGDICFVSEKSGAEKVCFLLNRFCSPHVFKLEGSNPRIVIDIENVHLHSGWTQMNLIHRPVIIIGVKAMRPRVLIWAILAPALISSA